MPNTPGLCSLLGTTVPLSAGTISALYPTHGTFVARWARDVIALARHGYLDRHDAARLIEAAAQSTVS